MGWREWLKENLDKLWNCKIVYSPLYLLGVRIEEIKERCRW